MNADSFIVYGRGVLHPSVLIEDAASKGFELQVGQPKVLDKTINGQRYEPIENLTIEVPEASWYGHRACHAAERRLAAYGSPEATVSFSISTFRPAASWVWEQPAYRYPGRGHLWRTATRNTSPSREIDSRTNGSLVSLETGVAIAYSMHKLLDRGKFFVEPGEEIYLREVW